MTRVKIVAILQRNVALNGVQNVDSHLENTRNIEDFSLNHSQF